MNVDHLLNQSCTITAAGAQDRFGKPTFGATVTERCRFMQTNKTIATAQQERAPIDAIVTLKSSTAALLNSRIGFSGVNYRVMRVDPAIDGQGIIRHVKLMVQKWNA